MAFAKLKALLRKAGERTVEGLRWLLGRALGDFPPQGAGASAEHCGYRATPSKKLLQETVPEARRAGSDRPSPAADGRLEPALRPHAIAGNIHESTPPLRLSETDS